MAELSCCGVTMATVPLPSLESAKNEYRMVEADDQPSHLTENDVPATALRGETSHVPATGALLMEVLSETRVKLPLGLTTAVRLNS